MRSVSFSFDTDADHEEFMQYAREKGMTLSAFAKMAIYHFKARYPQTRKKVSPLRQVFDAVNRTDIDVKSNRTTASTFGGIMGEGADHDAQ